MNSSGREKLSSETTEKGAIRCWNSFLFRSVKSECEKYEIFSGILLKNGILTFFTSTLNRQSIYEYSLPFLSLRCPLKYHHSTMQSWADSSVGNFIGLNPLCIYCILIYREISRQRQSLFMQLGIPAGNQNHCQPDNDYCCGHNYA